MASPNYISIRGAREHNLKDIDVNIPRDKLVVITGPSGSGKSSLAFDTIYAEAQRRFVESLSTYARQFLEQAAKPDVDSIEGLSPAIAIEQRTTSRNPRSTVGTITEIYDFMRVLFARAGTPWCEKFDRPITRQSPQDVVDTIARLETGTKVQVLAPIADNLRGSLRKCLDDLRARGFVRARVNGTIVHLEDEVRAAKNDKSAVEVVVDRLVVSSEASNRATDSVELALRTGEGKVLLLIETPDGQTYEEIFSEDFACADCGLRFPELQPQLFSFNSPLGACAKCQGLGLVMEVGLESVVPDPSLSIKKGAIYPWSTRPKLDAMYLRTLKRLCAHYKVSEDTPWKKLPEKFKQVVLYGSGDEKGDFKYRGRRRSRNAVFEGVIPNIQRRYHEAESDKTREFAAQFMEERVCSECSGKRLSKTSRIVRLYGMNITEVSALPLPAAVEYFSGAKNSPDSNDVVVQLCSEILARLQFLLDTGLEYLSLDRPASTLSGGETQRIRLASQLGSGLTGVLYVLDEPSIGLHSRDNSKLVNALERLRDSGNTVIVVEHDSETIRAADELIELGPSAGDSGGLLVAQGSPNQIIKSNKSISGPYLSGNKHPHRPSSRRSTNKSKRLRIKEAGLHNLKKVSVDFPLGLFICVTGVSGSGKSTLINETLYPLVHTHLFPHSKLKAGSVKQISGLENIDKVICVDQSPIGRTPRSNPATYTGLFGTIRELFAKVPEARARGYSAGRFSFNVKGGRCERCRGGGLIAIDMHFLPDLYLNCPVCSGKRYNRDTLEIRYRGMSIAEVLNLSVEEALQVFKNVPSAFKRLQALHSIGLGYVKLGQSATTLSGGEAQRVKLA
ncbi:MAG: excinuclease ABC subunit UvrA, partial [Bdellovibrionales bacterium]|nr:excinuclease ABC subunit UvrA [Bdellovibrionales bacterium]